MARRGRKKGLSDDDKAVWKQVARTVDPLDKQAAAKAAIAEKNAENQIDNPPHATPMGNPFPNKTSPMPKPQPTPEQLRKFTIGGKASAKPKSHTATRKPTISEDVASDPINMDPRKHKRMMRGKETPEARLDLHGMTLAQAHPELVEFVMTSHVRGLRLVLIITGKGKDKDDDSPIPTPRGILRNQVPRWLRQAPIGHLVQQVRESHRSHGGGGAYYVVLRNPSKTMPTKKKLLLPI